MKNLNDLAKELCKREGLKKQVNVAQMLEILGHLSEIIFKDIASNCLNAPSVDILHSNGCKRLKAKRKKLQAVK